MKQDTWTDKDIREGTLLYGKNISGNEPSWIAEGVNHDTRIVHKLKMVKYGSYAAGEDYSFDRLKDFVRFIENEFTSWKDRYKKPDDAQQTTCAWCGELYNDIHNHQVHNHDEGIDYNVCSEECMHNMMYD